MKQLLRPRRILLAVMFLALAVAAAGVGRAVASYRFTHRFGAITIRWIVTTYDGDGKIVDGPKQAYRVSSSTGRWQQVVETEAGRHRVLMGEPGRGVFTKAPDGDKRLSDAMSEPEPSSWSYWRGQPEYVRDDTVMGVPVVLLKVGDGPTYAEMYRAPDYHGAFIKQVIHRGLYSTVYEPVSVRLGEPPAEEFRYTLER